MVGCMHQKDPFKSVEKSMGLFPGSGFLSVTDMSVDVTNGDVKHNEPTNLSFAYDMYICVLW